MNVSRSAVRFAAAPARPAPSAGAPPPRPLTGDDRRFLKQLQSAVQETASIPPTIQRDVTTVIDQALASGNNLPPALKLDLIEMVSAHQTVQRAPGLLRPEFNMAPLLFQLAKLLADQADQDAAAVPSPIPSARFTVDA
ncbi:MAG: hypothetical protein IPK79_06295 [Vampirovibrionales bacterium]|nr:hypothetical protein [Vampirovibrionales bacterium]